MVGVGAPSGDWGDVALAAVEEMVKPPKSSVTSFVAMVVASPLATVRLVVR